MKSQGRKAPAAELAERASAGHLQHLQHKYALAVPTALGPSEASPGLLTTSHRVPTTERLPGKRQTCVRTAAGNNFQLGVKPSPLYHLITLMVRIPTRAATLRGCSEARRCSCGREEQSPVRALQGEELEHFVRKVGNDTGRMAGD